MTCEFRDTFSISTIASTAALASLPPSELTIKFDRRSTGNPIDFKAKKVRQNKHPKRISKPRLLEVAQHIDVTAPVPPISIFNPNPHPYLSHNERHLLHHYFTSTSNTVVLQGPMERHWVDLVPLCVQSHDYVVYGLLCLSALHLASLHFSSSGDRSICNKYHNTAVENMCKGISKFRTSEKDLHAGNMNSVFTFSGLNLFFELALMADIVYGEKNTIKHEIDRFVQMAMLTRNVIGLWLSFPMSFYWKMNKEEAEFTEMIRASTATDLEEAFEREVCQIIESRDIPEISSVMSWLHDLNSIITATDSFLERDLYTQAINILHVIFHLMATNPEDWVIVLRWMNKSASYMHLLQARKPFALVILGHYCVLLHHGPGQKLWWMRNWGQSMLHAIYDLLDDAWRAHLGWAMDTIQPGRTSPLVV